MPSTTTIRAAPPSAFHQQLDPRYSAPSLDRPHRSSSLAVHPPRTRRTSSSSGSDREFFGSSPRASWSPSSAATSITSSAPSFRGRARSNSLSLRENTAANSRPILINNDRRAHSPRYSRDYSPNRHSSCMVVQPASSMKNRRSRRDSITGRSEGGSTAYSTTIYDGNSPPRQSYMGPRSSNSYIRREVNRDHREQSDASSMEFPRRGRTKFPARLVTREVVEEMRYPYEMDETGGIVVLKALGRPQIDELVSMTERLRRKLNPSYTPPIFLQPSSVPLF